MRRWQIRHFILPVLVVVFVTAFLVALYCDTGCVISILSDRAMPDAAKEIIAAQHQFHGEFREFIQCKAVRLIVRHQIDLTNMFLMIWGFSIAILIFIFGKFYEMYYGQSLSRILLWQVTKTYFIIYFAIYITIPPLLTAAYLNGWIVVYCLLQVVNFLYLVGLIIFIGYYSRRKKIREIIRSQTVVDMNRIMSTGRLEEVSRLPVINVIKDISFDHIEDSRYLTALLLMICRSVAAQERRIEFHPCIAALLGEVMKRFSVESGADKLNAVKFFHQVIKSLQDDFDKELDGKAEERDSLRQKEEAAASIVRKYIPVVFAAVIPLIERSWDYQEGNAFTLVVNEMGWRLKPYMIILCLAYLEYLVECRNGDARLLAEVRQLDLPDINPRSQDDEAYLSDLPIYWYAWNKFDGQEEYGWDVMLDLMEDYRELYNHSGVARTEVFRVVEFGEARDEYYQDFNLVQTALSETV